MWCSGGDGSSTRRPYGARQARSRWRGLIEEGGPWRGGEEEVAWRRSVVDGKAAVAGEELGGVLKLKAGESKEAGPKREGEEGPSSELTGRGDYGGFGFDSGGADVPPAIRLGQGARGARMGHCVVRLLEEQGVGGA
jgi:hypothetical protein